jgi:hypothetical protein
VNPFDTLIRHLKAYEILDNVEAWGAPCLALVA